MYTAPDLESYPSQAMALRCCAGPVTTADSKKLEYVNIGYKHRDRHSYRYRCEYRADSTTHGCRIIHAGFPSFFGFG